MLGLRSFNLASQYLSENVTSDSDTCPSASHALIICASKLILWKIHTEKCLLQFEDRYPRSVHVTSSVPITNPSSPSPRYVLPHERIDDVECREAAKVAIGSPQ